MRAWPSARWPADLWCWRKGRRPVAPAGAIELGTYRTSDGDLVHCWYDETGVLMAERDGPAGKVRVDPRTVTTAVKLSDDPLWPDGDGPVQASLWTE